MEFTVIETGGNEKMIYDYEVTTGTGESLSLADYNGKVILVVNTATGCVKYLP